jgi:hypothetical protein
MHCIDPQHQLCNNSENSFSIILLTFITVYLYEYGTYKQIFIKM